MQKVYSRQRYMVNLNCSRGISAKPVKHRDVKLKRGGCYEREKQRGKGKQEGAAEKPQREEKDEAGEEDRVFQ